MYVLFDSFNCAIALKNKILCMLTKACLLCNKWLWLIFNVSKLENQYYAP